MHAWSRSDRGGEALPIAAGAISMASALGALERRPLQRQNRVWPGLDQAIFYLYHPGMPEVVSISEAKAQLSKLVKRAQAGETIYVGAYGSAQAVIGPVPARKPVPIGVWAHKCKPDAYEDSDLIEPDADVIAAFEQSVIGGDGGVEKP